MEVASEDRWDDDRPGSQDVQADRDAFVAGHDLHVYYGSRAAKPKPGMFSLRPPYARLPPEVRGRDALITNLEAELGVSRAATQILHGLGGSGKTTLALAVAKHFENAGRQVWWIPAADPATVSTAFRHLAVEVGAEPRLVQAAWEGELSAPDLLWRHLESLGTPWLLVVDEADDPQLLAADGGIPCDGTGWLRRSERGTILVTTRDGNPVIWQEAVLRPVRELEVAPAADVLLDGASRLLPDVGASQPELVRSARSLADTLGCLPLALHLAGAFLQAQLRRELRRGLTGTNQATTVARVMDEYLAGVVRNVRLLDEGADLGGRLADGHAGDVRVMATWERSLRVLEQRGLPESRILLQVLSCYAAAPVPLDILQPALLAEISGDTSGRGAFGQHRLDEVLDGLVDLGLVSERPVADPRGTSVACVEAHRLVLDTVAAHLAGQPERRRQVWQVAARMLEQAAGSVPDPVDGGAWWELAAPHCAELIQTCPPVLADIDTVFPLYCQTYGFLMGRASHASAAAMTTSALQLTRELLGAEDPRTLTCLHKQAQVLVSLGRSGDAGAVYTQVREARIRVLGPDHPDSLESRDKYAERMCLDG